MLQLMLLRQDDGSDIYDYINKKGMNNDGV
jgi:hypothetical protein